MKKAVIYLTINKVLPVMVLDERNEEIYSEELHVERQTVELVHWNESKVIHGAQFVLRKALEVNHAQCVLNVNISYGITNLEGPDSYKKIHFKAYLAGNEDHTRVFDLKTPVDASKFSLELNGQKFADTEKPNINMFDFEIQIDEI